MPAISDLLDSVVSATPAVSWSIRLTGTSTGDGAAHDPDRPLKTASVGKLVLLAEVGRRIELDPAYGSRLLAREGVEPIADSGVLQHLSADSLAVGDLALLVGYASDNWATNLLLDEIGFGAVAETGARLGLEHTMLLDRVRRPRMPADPPALSCGTGRELCDLMARLQRGDLLSPGVSERLNRWLATGVDLSMVASAFGFDPLSHAEDERGLRLVNKPRGRTCAGRCSCRCAGSVSGSSAPCRPTSKSGTDTRPPRGCRCRSGDPVRLPQAAGQWTSGLNMVNIPDGFVFQAQTCSE